jgi:hypothetical protein
MAEVRIYTEEEQMLLNQILEYKRLRTEKERIQNAMDAIKDQVTAVMDEKQITKLCLNDIDKVTISEVFKTTFDTKRFEKEHAELYDQYTKSTVSRRVLFS